MQFREQYLSSNNSSQRRDTIKKKWRILEKVAAVPLMTTRNSLGWHGLARVQTLQHKGSSLAPIRIPPPPAARQQHQTTNIIIIETTIAAQWSFWSDYSKILCAPLPVTKTEHTWVCMLSKVMRDDKRQTRADRVQAAPATANASFDDVAMMPTTWLGWAHIGRSSIMLGKLTSAPPHSPPLAFPANLDMWLIGHSLQRAGAMWHHLPLSSQGLGWGVGLHSTSLHDVMGIPAVGPFSVYVVSNVTH